MEETEMKKFLLIAIILGIAGTGFGQMLAMGTSELKVNGLLDFETSDDTLFDLGIFYGQFFADYVECGVGISITESDHVSLWSLGVNCEFNYDMGTELVPFVGVGLAYANYDVETPGGDSDEDNALVISGSAGAKYFIAENIAVSAALVLEVASEDIFPEQEEFSDTNSKIELSMRFFF